MSFVNGLVHGLRGPRSAGTACPGVPCLGEYARPVRSVWLAYSGVAAARFAAATSVRFDTPSLANTDETWWSTVFGEITSLMAMLALVRPSQSNSSTSCSR